MNLVLSPANHLFLVMLNCVIIFQTNGHGSFGDRTVEIPAVELHKATLIFLHGHNRPMETGDGWAKILAQIRKPYMKIVCPTPSAMPFYNPNSEDKKYPSWFYFEDLQKGVQGLHQPLYYVHNLIQDEIDDNIPPEMIMIGGSDQGGALAIYAALTFPEKLAGMIAVSTYVPNAMSDILAKNKIQANKNIHILQCDRYPVSSSHHGYLGKILKKISPNVESRWHPLEDKALLMKEGKKDFAEFFDKHLQPVSYIAV